MKLKIFQKAFKPEIHLGEQYVGDRLEGMNRTQVKELYEDRKVIIVQGDGLWPYTKDGETALIIGMDAKPTSMNWGQFFAAIEEWAAVPIKKVEI